MGNGCLAEQTYIIFTCDGCVTCAWISLFSAKPAS